MGKPKLLLPWGNTSILGHLVHQWLELRATQIALVLAAANSPVSPELDRLGFSKTDRIPNPAPERGMFSSIQCAAQWAAWNPAVTHLAIALGDQPQVRMDTLRSLASFAAANPQQVCQPARNGRGKHPVILPLPLFRQLANSTAENLKQFLLGSGAPLARFDADDDGLDFDLDLPDDYEKAVRLYASKTSAG